MYILSLLLVSQQPGWGHLHHAIPDIIEATLRKMKGA
jgi:hypothetical protein